MELEPNGRVPAVLLGFALFLALVGWVGLKLGTFEHAWWFVLPLWSLAAFQVFAVVKAFRQRRQRVLFISPNHISIYGITLHRPEIKSISPRKEFTFSGVMITLTDGRSLGIRDAHHEPAAVLQAFKVQGYPVEDGFSLA
jgi:hypothetical protein